MNNTIEIIKYKGKEIKIGYDEFSENPIDSMDFLGTINCFHRNYNIGHDHNYNLYDLNNIINHKDFLSLPVYMYDHSGITINTTGFSCQWDSGQIGIIYVSKEKIRQEYSVKRITKKIEKQVYEVLRSEIKTLDIYLTGQIFGFQTDNDSCYGFYDYDECIQEAKSQIDYEEKQAIKKHTEKVKQYVKNGVPLLCREALTI